MYKAISILALAVSAFAGTNLVANPRIQSFYRLTDQAIQRGRVDFVVMLEAEWQDPYDSGDVALDLELVAPSGESVTLPCFYARGESGAASVWNARFAPAEAGAYRGRFVLRDGLERAESAELAFDVEASERRGFLRTDTLWTLRFDNGERFRGVGENICWEARSNDDSRYFKDLHENPRFNYEYMLGRLRANGGNFFRTWMCAWNLPLEWSEIVDTDRYRPSERRMNPDAIRRLDDLVELCERLGVYMMLTLDHAGCYIGGQWELNSYNAKNGGPAKDAREFFERPEARRRYQDRLRFLVARWGYSPSIAAWEFFNEVDNVSYAFEPRIPDALVADWHQAMSDYLAKIDVYGHLRTTSVSHRDIAGLESIPTIDIDQRHIYGNSAWIADTIRQKTMANQRPYVIGEFSYEWDWSKNFNEFGAEMDTEFELGMWRGLFSPTPILPMSWWWEFFDERDVIESLQPIAALNAEMLSQGTLSEATAAWSGDSSVYAVTAGDRIYVLLANGAEKVDTGMLSVESVPEGGALFEYEPVRGDWKRAGSPQGKIAVPARTARVFAVRASDGGK